jgi:hemerythrin superfamily protein
MSKAPARQYDAVDLLDADHIAVSKLFAAFKKICEQDASGDDRREVADQICEALTIHAQIEEEIFYPQLREAINADDLLDEAEVEHDTAKDLIAQIERMSPDDDLFDARVRVLGEYIDHHVNEEREGIFVRARRSTLDLVAMADELSERKLELTDEYRAEHA